MINKNILAAIIWHNEAITLYRVKAVNDTLDWYDLTNHRICGFN